MDEEIKEREDEVRKIFTHTSKSYEFVVKYATLGMDGLWKRRMLRLCLDNLKLPPLNVLDIGCGTGLLTFALAEQYPFAWIVGLDIMPEYLEIARSKITPGLKGRISFVEGNADELDKVDLRMYGQFDRKLDLIVSSYVPKYVDVLKLVLKCDKILAPGGLLLLHDFTKPRNAILRQGYDLYWLPLSIVLMLWPSWREVGKRLKEVIWRSNWVRNFTFAASTLGYERFADWWQPLEIACIVYAKKGGKIT